MIVFKSSNDRLIINVFKALGLLDDSGLPVQRYYDFLDQTQSKRILAVGIQEAYEDLFNLRVDAQNMTNDEIKNKLKTLTQGQKGDKVIECMAKTFRILCDYADFTKIKATPTEAKPTSAVEAPLTHNEEAATKGSNKTNMEVPAGMNLHYNIQIHLPETTNVAVYDAIFQSLKKHLI